MRAKELIDRYVSNIINEVDLVKARTATPDDMKRIKGFSRIFWVWDVYKFVGDSEVRLAVGSAPKLGMVGIVAVLGGPNSVFSGRILFPAVSDKVEGQKLANRLASRITQRWNLFDTYNRILRFDGAMKL